MCLGLSRGIVLVHREIIVIVYQCAFLGRVVHASLTVTSVHCVRASPFLKDGGVRHEVIVYYFLE